jgi:hypothetical protein
MDAPPASVNLSAEGTADWAHWGLASPTSFNRKSSLPQLISDVTLLNASPAALTNYSDNLVAFSWSDGTPTPASGGSATGIFLFATNDPPAGFRLTVPATNSLRRLRVYLGLSAVHGRLDAWLDDFSALPYSDSSLYKGYDDACAVYTIQFASANAGARLVVTWTPAAVFNPFYGNLTWQAATLAELPPSPVLQVVAPPPIPGQFALSFLARTGVDYAVQYVDTLDSTNWQTLSNFPGQGSDVLVTDPAPGPWQRFYRVLAQ